MKTKIVLTIEREYAAGPEPNAVGILLDIEKAVTEYRLALARLGDLTQIIIDDRTGTCIKVEVSNA